MRITPTTITELGEVATSFGSTPSEAVLTTKELDKVLRVFGKNQTAFHFRPQCHLNAATFATYHDHGELEISCSKCLRRICGISVAGGK
jgi:hypothetical protein